MVDNAPPGVPRNGHWWSEVGGRKGGGANEETLSLVFKTHPDACFLKAMNYIMQVRKLLMAKKRFPSHSFFQSFHFRQY